MIPPPHGGRLIDRALGPLEAERRREELRALPKLWPESDQVLDAEKIATGAYSPLEGFMDRSTLESVLGRSRLPSSLVWPMPVVLSPPGSRNQIALQSMRVGDQAALLDASGRFVALLDVQEKFPLDKVRVARQTYGTTDRAHPNVADLDRTGPTAVAGPVRLVTRRELPTGIHEMTPGETRLAFARRRWSNVAAYQTRNVPHRAHEYLQRQVLEREDIDGLFIHPVVGRLKAGDYRPEVVLRAYELFVRAYYPWDRVLLASLSIGMRYAGPKAALFLAIVRKNFGCSHYVVGRDQAGIGTRYDPYDCHRIFDEHPIGVVPLRFREVSLCRRCESVGSPRSCGHGPEALTAISQTAIRTAIREGRPVPEEMVRPEIAELLKHGPDLLVPERPSIGTVPEEPEAPFAGRSENDGSWEARVAVGRGAP